MSKTKAQLQADLATLEAFPEDLIAKKGAAEIKRQLAEIEAQEARLATLTPAQRIAEAVHGKQCHWNHTDGCDWYYHSWNNCYLEKNPRSVRAEYLAKATSMLEVTGGDEAIIMAILHNL